MVSPRTIVSRQVNQPEPKRRKVRKGTHSCWECKRRKMKCIIDPLTNAICNGCRRRGSKCVSQEFPEDVSFSIDKSLGKVDDMRRVEMHVNSSEINEDGMREGTGLLTPASIRSDSSQYLTFYKHSKKHTSDNDTSGVKLQSITTVSSSQTKYEDLSWFLHESLPSYEDTERICKASSRPSVLGHEVLSMPYPRLDQSGLKTSETLLNIPNKNQHPVLIAKYMFSLAIFLQYLHPEIHNEIKGLSESPQSLRERLADLAIHLVTTNDELLGSIEGLECIMLEGLYQANLGNLRRSWVTGRRAMGIAQLMGLNRSNSRPQYKVLDPATKFDPQYMWHRIIFLDRLLCLLLGLPQGCSDCTMASDASLADDTPTGRLERVHCIVASQVLERNESNPSLHDISLTRSLDLELQKAARMVPSSWWLAPDLDTAAKDSETLFWDTRRLIAQVYHYNLLNQLHLPYMLHSSSAERSKYEYFRITCVNASREMLSRFIALRSFNKLAYSCRSVDFIALMAAMTLLLAHLDSHRGDAENLLAHQYHSDRAMIEQAQKNMLEVNRMSSDALSAKSADILGRLLAIEVDTIDGHPSATQKVIVHETTGKAVPPGQDDDPVASVHIPYFGIIKIARDGMSREAPEPQISRTGPLKDGSATDTQPHFAGSRVNPNYGRDGVTASVSQEGFNGYAEPQAQVNLLSLPVAESNEVAPDFTSHLERGMSDPLLQPLEYPELAAGGEDWAFQGVDMAFFESLMRSTGDNGEEMEWTAWQK